MKVLLVWLSVCIFALASEYKNHYPFESDTILTAWLIKTYVDKNATFKSVPKGTKVDKKYALNTPNSPFRRNARFTAYEMAKHHFNVSDTCSDSLVKIIKVLEMMPWKKHEFVDILNFEEGLAPLFPEKIGDSDLSKVFSYIDLYCKGQK